ncbi:MAG: DUF2252 family protein [Acidobacteriota bacterium]
MIRALTRVTAFGLLMSLSSTAATGWLPEDDDARRQRIETLVLAVDADLPNAIRQAKQDAMRATPHGFVRGTATLFHQDVAERGHLEASPFQGPDTITWIQGDAHIRNVGAFENDEGEIVFDFDDFDQAWPGSYLLDVWRLAVSMRVAADDREIAAADADDAVARFGGAYLSQLARFVDNDDEEGFRLDEDTAGATIADFLDETDRAEGRWTMLDEWRIVRRRDGEKRRRFRSDHDELAAVADDERQAIEQAIGGLADSIDSPLHGEDRYFEILDIARRVGAGVGSHGVDRFYVLIRGASRKKKDDILLDVKEQRSEPAPALHGLEPPMPGDAGCRVARAEKVLLAEADDHLGCVTIDGRSFSVRQRNPHKNPFKLKRLRDAETLLDVAGDWGRLLAALHARGDRDLRPRRQVERAILDRVGDRRDGFIAEVRVFADGYARQVAIDHRLFRELTE